MGARGAALLAVFLLGACAHRPPAPAPLPDALSDCEARWQAAEWAARNDGLLDAARRPVPGFPHYRVDRLLASWRDDPLSPAQWQDLTARLSALAGEARAIEAARAGQLPDPKLTACATRLQQADLRDPQRLRALQTRLQVPDDYRQTQRLFGAYWLARPFLRAGIRGFHRDMQARFLDAPIDGSAVRRYTPPDPEGTVPTPATPTSPLGFPVLDETEWRALALRHAPHWRVETRSADDLPGTPWRDAQGRLGFHAEPVVYWARSWVRQGDRVLIGLEYTLWFAARTAKGWLDPYAGPVDGLVWRVVLDPNGQPMVYDAQHPCGCYRYLYPTEGWARREGDPRREETFLTPPWTPTHPPLQLSVAAGDHQLLHVGPASPDPATATHYALRDYRQLELGRLFGPQGLIAGTERGERWWLWPSGVHSPGAMRQRGRQANAFVGERHFDDAEMIDALFVDTGASQR